MTDKQITLEILRFGQPARVLEGPGPQHHLRYFGVNHESTDGVDHDAPVGTRWQDIWGTVWHKEHAGVMGFPRGNPLTDLPRDLAAYRWPDPDNERLCGQIYANAAGWDRATTFLSGNHRDTLWERAYMLCGMENMMCNFLTEPEATRELLHRIMDFQLGIARHYLAVGVEMVGFSDDLGTQHGLLLSPEIIHAFLVPEYRRLISLYKAHNVMIDFHSCGHITPLLETFIALGIDCLNPIQATANDLAEVRRITQGRLTLHGGVSSALLMDGPVERIHAEVRRCLSLLGREGGYFCAPDQYLPFPEEHRQAFTDALTEFGSYPLAD